MHRNTRFSGNILYSVNTWRRKKSILMKRIVYIAGPCFVLAVLLLGVLVPAWERSARADTGSDTWSLTGSMSIGRRWHTATLLDTGQVLVAGGQGGPGALVSAELYDPASGAWSSTGNLHAGRYHHTATRLGNGQVLVAGGQDSTNTVLGSAELYDPATGTWSQTGDMSVALTEATATLLDDGQVLVTGGLSNVTDDTRSAVAELYDPATGTWSLTGSLHTARNFHTATLLEDGRVLIAGGQSFFSLLTSTELYDPATGTWSLAGNLVTPLSGPTATLLFSGKVLLAGGADNTQVGSLRSAVAELYDPATDTWSLTGSMNTPRIFHTATLLDNGQVLVAGGGAVFGAHFLDSAELYDPTIGTWAPTGSLQVGRFNHAATILRNGQVLVMGGNTATGFASSAELFFPPPAPADTTPPALRLPGTVTADATSPQGAHVTYTVHVSDPDNVPAQLTVSCTPGSGSLFPIGTTTVTCQASDPAGNTTTGAFQVVVKGAGPQIDDLMALVDSFGLSSGLEQSFNDKLLDARDALNAGDATTACNDLRAFSNEAGAQSGKALTADQANQLLSAAERVQAVLGC